MNGINDEKKYTVFLIDCENVGIKGTIPNHIDGESKFVLFVNNGANISVTASYMQWLMENREYIEFVESKSTGKNAIDFIIVHYLCMDFVANPVNRYRIVSNDKGFDTLLSKMKGQGCDVERIAGIEVDNDSTEEVLHAAGTYNKYFAHFMGKVRSKTYGKPKKLTSLISNIMTHKPSSSAKKADMDIAIYIVGRMKDEGVIIVDEKENIKWIGLPAT